MDRLRALQYLIAAADERSFSAAARRLGVSQPAVQKLVTALEHELGTALFERRSTGLAITADGADYVARCRPLLDGLREADEQLAARDRPRGRVVLGASHMIAHDYLGPGLPGFHRRFPDIEIEHRPIHRLSDPMADGVDVFIMHGWQEQPDLVRLPIGHARYVVAATRGYWAEHGQPARPRELASHRALLFRSGRTALDRWRFQRGTEVEVAEMRGWLSSSQRELLLQAALAGAGVVRLLAPPALPEALVEVLEDWTALEAPPVQILYRAEHRASPRVRRFVEFATRRLRELLPATPTPRLAPGADRPDWWDRRDRSSAAPLRARTASGERSPP